MSQMEPPKQFSKLILKAQAKDLLKNVHEPDKWWHFFPKIRVIVTLIMILLDFE